MIGVLGRGSALRAALAATVGQPVPAILLALAAGTLVALAALAAGVALRAGALDAPAWTQAQAFVLVAGAEGETDLAAVGAALRRVPGVAAADFVGRDAALAELARRKSLVGSGVGDLRPNPLPDAFTVRFVRALAPADVEAAVALLARVRNVETVEFAPEPYRRLHATAELLGRLGLLAQAALGSAALVVLALALVLWSRIDRAELAVLRLLGADPAVIRRPYVYAAALQAALVVGLACAGERLAGGWLEPVLAQAAQQFGLAWPALARSPWLDTGLVAGAALAGGLLASAGVRLAMRRA